jgi:hypothetical protein
MSAEYDVAEYAANPKEGILFVRLPVQNMLRLCHRRREPPNSYRLWRPTDCKAIV